MPYEISITLKKGLYNLGIAMLSGGIAAGISYLSALDPAGEFALFIAIIPILKMFENYLKHRNDV